jgi:hypothetical protein
MAAFGALLTGIGGLFTGGVTNAALNSEEAASEATYAANESELIASNTRLNTMATKVAEVTNTQEFTVASEEAHNHVVRSYIEAVKQVQ